MVVTEPSTRFWHRTAQRAERPRCKRVQHANRHRNRANNRNRAIETLTIARMNMSSPLRSIGLRQRHRGMSALCQKRTCSYRRNQISGIDSSARHADVVGEMGGPRIRKTPADAATPAASRPPRSVAVPRTLCTTCTKQAICASAFDSAAPG
jgi:hypothetical protein